MQAIEEHGRQAEEFGFYPAARGSPCRLLPREVAQCWVSSRVAYAQLSLGGLAVNWECCRAQSLETQTWPPTPNLLFSSQAVDRFRDSAPGCKWSFLFLPCSP